MDIVIRNAESSDAEEIARIYNYEVLHSEVNYESVPQTVEYRREWIGRIKSLNFPLFVATKNDSVIAFAALTPFNILTGYKHSATGSIYIDPEHQGAGLGKKLALALISSAKQVGIHAIIAGINSENKRSISLLKSVGFEQAGYFKEIGFKNGKWLDDVCLQLLL